MAGRWVMALIQTTFAVMPAAGLLVRRLELAHGGGAISIGTLVAFTTLQVRLFFPIGQLLSVGVDVQTSLALFDRVFEYLDLPVDIAEKPDAVELGDLPRRRRLRRRLVPLLARRGRGHSRTSPSRCRRGRRSRSSARPAPGKTTMGYLVARLYDVERGARDDRRLRHPRRDLRVARRDGRRRLAGDVSLPRHGAREPPLRAAGGDRRGDRGGGPRRPDPRPRSPRSPRATRPSSASAATASRAARSSGSRSRARSSAIRPCWSSTRRRARSTRRPSGPSRTRSTGWRRAGRRSRSRTGSRPSATPTRSSSSTAAGSSSAGTHEELLELGGRYAALVSRDAELAPLS